MPHHLSYETYYRCVCFPETITCKYMHLYVQGKLWCCYNKDIECVITLFRSIC